MEAGKICGMLYLDVSPTKCSERIRERNRGEESGLPLAYLGEIAEGHEKLMKEM